MLQRIPQRLLPGHILLALFSAMPMPIEAAPRFAASDSLDIRPAFLQTTRILGKIVNEASRPVANAAILIAGSERGTVTNLSGSFEIADAPLNGMLVVKHPDFETRQVPIVKSASEYVIMLKSRPQATAARMKNPARPAKKDGESTQDGESGSSVRLDRWPHFQGGYKALNKFLANNLKYPPQALEAGVKGQVQVSFLLDEEGNVSSGRIIKSPGMELDEEALRLVSLMPKWAPAQKDGRPVAVWYTVGIQFDPEVDKLPLKIKEETPGFLGRLIKLNPLKTPLPVKAEFKRLFGNNTIDLSAHEPPQTRLHTYGAGFATRPAYIPPKFDFHAEP
ncbi:MAG: energy transducer TonB [Dyadobacter sp. 50-39]|mgnify:CR=1 FL=1|uniref:TonB family protein n=1 Tax=Dyadobacter sp. 50-39 TaxID=1895756 RepID=UPI00096056A2|nr:TonB family protein [Dyadobacter sp. 50-39]OJV16152.1 MAG: energy transducer TonB [Dyadobacter sp. 50-39]